MTTWTMFCACHMAHWNDIYANGVVVGALTDHDVAGLNLKPKSQVSTPLQLSARATVFCMPTLLAPLLVAQVHTGPSDSIVWAALQGRLELMTDGYRAAALALVFATTSIPTFFRHLDREPECLPALLKLAGHHQVCLLQAATQLHVFACAWLSPTFAYYWETAVLT